MDAKMLFDTLLPETLPYFADRLRELDEVFVFKIENAGSWVLSCKGEMPSIKTGSNAEDPSATIEMDDIAFATCCKNMHAGVKLYLTNQIKVTGEPAKILKLLKLFEVTRPYGNNSPD